MSVAVVKLGIGNTASVMFALERLGADAVLTDDPARIADAERVIMPGVGAAAHAMRRIDETGLRQTLGSFTRPLLGICLGQQILYETSEEGDARGLGLIAGGVKMLPGGPALPLPHMGWSALHIDRKDALLEGVSHGAYVYFVHSYASPVGAATLASAEHGVQFSAAIGASNVYGCQFHPERSGETGARILANFLSLPC